MKTLLFILLLPIAAFGQSIEQRVENIELRLDQASETVSSIAGLKLFGLITTSVGAGVAIGADPTAGIIIAAAGAVMYIVSDFKLFSLSSNLKRKKAAKTEQPTPAMPVSN
jgi:hypothetical protein